LPSHRIAAAVQGAGARAQRVADLGAPAVGQKDLERDDLIEVRAQLSARQRRGEGEQ